MLSGQSLSWSGLHVPVLAGGLMLTLLGSVAAAVFRGALRHRILVGVFGVLLALALAEAAFGRLPSMWIPPLLLAVLCGLLLVFRYEGLRQAAAHWASAHGKKRWQTAALLLTSLALAGWWGVALERQVALARAIRDGRRVWFDPAGLEPVPGNHAFTDRGRPIPVFRAPSGDTMTPLLRQGEAMLMGAQDQWKSVIRVAPPDPEHNCHGWLFAGGKYWVKGQDVSTILAENGYVPVTEPRLNDLAVYRDEQGCVQHSGVVWAIGGSGVVLIQSKWGGLGRYLHFPDHYCHPFRYAYYRSDRPGHLLRGLASQPVETKEPEFASAAEAPFCFPE